jgi:hypothetical protein
VKCRHEQLRDRMSIKVHEWPLPGHDKQRLPSLQRMTFWQMEYKQIPGATSISLIIPSTRVFTPTTVLPRRISIVSIG